MVTPRVKVKKKLRRPRTTVPQPDEMLILGDEMLEWIKDNNPLHVSAWYSIQMMITEQVWRQMIRCPEFAPYYDMALKLIGQKYIDKTSNVRDSISHRWQRIYFKDLKESEDEDKKFEASLKHESDNVSDEDKEQYQKVIDQLDQLRKRNPNLKLPPSS